MLLVLVWIVLMAGAFYMLLWRPQQRRMAMVRALQTQLQEEVFLNVLLRTGCDDYTSNPMKTIVDAVDFSDAAQRMAGLTW